MWPTPAEQLAARQQIISAEGMLTQYRETLRALIGADAQSMPAIHPVALPALQRRYRRRSLSSCWPAARTCRRCAGT